MSKDIEAVDVLGAEESADSNTTARDTRARSTSPSSASTRSRRAAGAGSADRGTATKRTRRDDSESRTPNTSQQEADHELPDRHAIEEEPLTNREVEAAPDVAFGAGSIKESGDINEEAGESSSSSDPMPVIHADK